MPKIGYKHTNLNATSLALIETANDIIAEYQAQGYQLTVRQLYYQFVARDIIPNTMKSYKRLADRLNVGRLVGLIDWTAIEDRTRNTIEWDHWTDPAHIISDAVEWFQLDKWAGQKYRPEVWIEKEALAGVIARVCRRLDLPYLSCRGYTSQSEMWASAMRLKGLARDGQQPIILHFGDHDPSGIDMTRDIIDRMKLFAGRGIQLERLALNMDQIKEQNPPPNPAKTTDSRFASYVGRFGHESWELDALEPAYLDRLITEKVRSLRDQVAWDKAVALENEQRNRLIELSADWE